MSDDFGRDVGLIHKAIVTGRKAKAGTTFWTALADNEVLFKAILPLVVHAHDLTHRGVPLNDLPVDKTEEIQAFVQRVNTAIGGDYCSCGGGGPTAERLFAVNKMLESEGRFIKTPEEFKQYVQDFLNSQLEEMGISATELLPIPDIVDYTNRKLYFTQGDCVKLTKLAAVIKEALARRQLIAQIYTASVPTLNK